MPPWAPLLPSSLYSAELLMLRSSSSCAPIASPAASEMASHPAAVSNWQYQSTVRVNWAINIAQIGNPG